LTDVNEAGSSPILGLNPGAPDDLSILGLESQMEAPRNRSADVFLEAMGSKQKLV
jgi:hypothetical protein